MLRICKIWANLNKPAQNSRLPSYDQETSSLSTNCDDELDSIHTWEEHTFNHGTTELEPTTARYHFDASMYDYLGRATIVKVYSHQLKADYMIKMAGGVPSPNFFAASANQTADNAAT
jgi:hypothetical protein